MTTLSEPYWSLAQAVAWICKREPAAVNDISGDESAETLKLQLLKYRVGRKISRLQKLSTGTVSFSEETIAETDFPTGMVAVTWLQEAILTGQIRTVAYNVTTGCLDNISGPERAELEFRIWPDDPIRPFGFFSTRTGECHWIKPRVSASDVQRYQFDPKQKN